MTRSYTDDFIEVTTPEAAVDRLAALYEQATSALRAALKQYIKDRQLPQDAQSAFRYPELRLTYQSQGEVPSSIRAYARLQVPGVYSITVTQPGAFRRYLESQLGHMMRDFAVVVEVGFSQVSIPYPYVVEEGDELGTSGVTAIELARVFPQHGFVCHQRWHRRWSVRLARAGANAVGVV